MISVLRDLTKIIKLTIEFESSYFSLSISYARLSTILFSKFVEISIIFFLNTIYGILLKNLLQLKSFLQALNIGGKVFFGNRVHVKDLASNLDAERLSIRKAFGLDHTVHVINIV